MSQKLDWHTLNQEEFQAYGERSQLALIKVCLTIANESDPKPNTNIASVRQYKAKEILNSINEPFKAEKFNRNVYQFMEAALAQYGIQVRNELPDQLGVRFAQLFNAFAGVNSSNPKLHKEPSSTVTTSALGQ